MQKLILFIICVFIVNQCAFGQIDAQSTINTNGLQANMFVKAPTIIDFPDASNAVTLNAAISLPANGATDISAAPTVSEVNSPIAGMSITSLDVFLANDRYVYSFQYAITNYPMNTWAANSENLVLSVTFSSSASGDFPRLDNLLTTDGGTNSYFYFEVRGTQRSDTEGNPFYANGSEIIGEYNIDEKFIQSETVLPITLSSFTAQKINNKTVLLEWTSSLEINSSHFEVERSTDGENWVTLGRVEAAGNSSSEIDYSFIDRNFDLRRNQSQIYYYRLNQIDNDGYQEYSEIRAVRMDGGYADISLYPNPTTELLHIDVSSDLEGMVRYDITDIQGRMVANEQIDITSQKIHLVNLREKGLQSGIYMVRLYTNRSVLSSQKIVLVSR